MEVKKNGKNIVAVTVSVITCILLALCLFISVITDNCRDYLTSEQFNSMIDKTDFSKLTFSDENVEITLEEYVKDYVTQNIEKYLTDNPLSNINGLLYPFADSIADYAVDKVLSSEYVNAAVKREIHSIFDYFLYSDYNAAKQRLKDGITLENNAALNPENAPTFEECIEAEVKMAVFSYIEGESGISCDEIILLLSEKTVMNLKIISVLLLVIITAINLVRPRIILLFLSATLLCFGGLLNSCITNFYENCSPIQHQFFSPLTEAISDYVSGFLIAGFICLLLFVVSRLFIKKIRYKKIT